MLNKLAVFKWSLWLSTLRQVSMTHPSTYLCQLFAHLLSPNGIYVQVSTNQGHWTNLVDFYDNLRGAEM